MSWVTIIWSMISSACLTLALVHLLVWWGRRDARGNMLFSILAVATAVYAGFELWMMHAKTPVAFGMALRWAHVPIWVIVVSLVAFVRLYLRAGRSWLAWTVCAARTLSLIINFVTTPNINYREIISLRHVSFFGERVACAEGVTNPWTLIGQLSLILVVIFLADATITVWRRGDRQRATMLGGSMVLFAVAGVGQSILIFWGITHGPLTASFFFMGVVATMGYELSQDLLRTARLSDDLRESEHRMALVTHAANLGMWVWDVVKDEVWMTDKGRALFGLSPDALLDYRTLVARVHPEDRSTQKAAIRRALENQDEYASEYRVLLPDGQVRWIAGRGRVEFSGSKPLRMRGVSLDITERKQAELEAARQRMDLAHASRLTMVGELTASIAHEINQPLGAILSNAETADILLESKQPQLEEVQRILADIRKDDLRASETIRRVRELLRKRELELKPIDLNAVISDVLRLLDGETHRRGVEIEKQFVDALPAVRGDAIHLQQVLLNLILNGMEAVSESSATNRRITIGTAYDGKDNVEVVVEDSGPGIPSERLALLFDSFFTTKPHGMGLGLSIVRSIVEAHGGRIWAENNSSGGACFRFTLPVN
jgi:two-component system sensor kinase FixL